MTLEQGDRIIDLLIESRGEDGCEEACKKIKENFGVNKLRDISEESAVKIIDKLELELVEKNVKDVFKNDLEPQDIKCPDCGGLVNRKGMFLICKKCRKIVEVTD